MATTMLAQAERSVLTDLVARVRDLAASPKQAARTHLWRKANSLDPAARTYRPPLWVIVHSFRQCNLPTPPLVCTDDAVRDLEERLHFTLYREEHFQDDLPVEEPVAWVRPVIRGLEDWGLQWKVSDRVTDGGSYHYEPVVHTAADLAKLKVPTLEYDVEETQRNANQLREMVGDLLPVKVAKYGMPTFHLTGYWCYYRGLDNVMMDMYDDPDFLHAGMQMMAEIQGGIARQIEALGLLADRFEIWTLTEELPPAGYDPDHYRLTDTMAWAESQELTLVSPAMHAEFALQYEKPLMEMYGLSTYGCCEDLTQKIEMLRAVRNLRSIGVSPWADVRRCVEQVGVDYALSWRPNPAHLAGPDFDEEFIRAYLRANLEYLRGTACHLLLKDIHSVAGDPSRITKWSRMLREEMARLWEDAAEER